MGSSCCASDEGSRLQIGNNKKDGNQNFDAGYIESNGIR